MRLEAGEYLALLAGILALTAGFFYGQTPSQARLSDFSAALASYVVPDIRFGIQSYAVSGGEVVGNPPPAIADPVLRLAWYATISDTDPYFSFSGADTSAVRQSVQALQVSIADLRSTPSFTGREQQNALSTLHPIRFLSTISDTEDARRSLIKNPTYPNALHYHTLLLSSMVAYREDIAHIRAELVYYAADTNLNVLLHYQGRVSTPSSFLVYLDTLDESASHDLVAENDRFSCLVGAGACSKNSLALAPEINFSDSMPALTGGADTTFNIAAARVLTDTVLNTKEIPQSDRFSLIGHTGCFNDGPSIPDEVEGWISPSDTGIRSISFQPFAALAFTTVTPYSGANTNFADLTKAGYKVRLESSGNYYTCPDLSYYLRFATAYTIWEDLREEPLFASYADSGRAPLKAAAILEKKFVSSNDISVSDLRQYLSEVSDLYAEKGEQGLADLLSGPEHALRVRHLLELWRDQSGSLELVLGQGAYQVQLFKRQWENMPLGRKPPSALYFLTARSYPSLYFFSANESIAGKLPAPPNYQTAFESTVTLPLSIMNGRYSLSQMQDIVRLQYKDSGGQ